MGWQPGSASGPGACSDGDSRSPGQGTASSRDPRLAMFASEDGIDALVPSALLAMAGRGSGPDGAALERAATSSWASRGLGRRSSHGRRRRGTA